MKLFEDEISLFSVVRDSNISANDSKSVNNDMQKISQWTYKWKIPFNSDLKKQPQEVIFSRKLNKSTHPKIFFDNAPVFLNDTLNVNLHIMEKMFKPLKGTSSRNFVKEAPDIFFLQYINHFSDFIRIMVI